MEKKEERKGSKSPKTRLSDKKWLAPKLRCCGIISRFLHPVSLEPLQVSEVILETTTIPGMIENRNLTLQNHKNNASFYKSTKHK